MVEIKVHEVLSREELKSALSEPSYDHFNESMIFQFKMQNIEERIKSILKTDIYSRKNDLWLLILYYAKMGMIKLIIPLEEFHKANPPETITRIKRRLIEKAKKGDESLHFLLNDTQNINIREDHSFLYQTYFHNEKAAEMVKLIK